jgi:HSP20 family protein
MNRLIERTHTPLVRRGVFGDDFDRMFENFFQPIRWVEEATSDLVPAMDVIEREHEYVVRTEMPGVKKEDLDITIENGVLTVSGETKSETEEKKGERVIRQERRCGKYVRSLRLGQQVDDRSVKANLRDGVLELILPKAEEVKPKKISVDVA